MHRNRSTFHSLVSVLAACCVSVAFACGPTPSSDEDDDDDAGGGDTGEVADTYTAGDADAGDTDTTDTRTEDGDGESLPCEVPSIWYQDQDMDGYGTEDTTTMACSVPEGYVDEKGDCNDMRSEANPDGTEMCDGLDNDCDGDTDEMLVRDCQKQMGLCAGATTTCKNGAFPLCSADQYGSDYEAAESTCDDIDNDCDGQTDENLTEDCSNQTGVCSGSSVACTNGSFPSCSDSDYGPDYESTESSCDNLDNDCDSQTDENLPDQDCSLQDGVCSGATVSCQNGIYPTCGNAEYGSDYEANDESSCDTLDNDCDGQTDEVTKDCPKQEGVCAGATAACTNGSFETCTDSHYGSDYESTESSCDGLDNDCDGQTDRLSGCNYHVTISGSPTAAITALEVNSNTGDVFVAGMDGDVLKDRQNKTSQDVFVAKYDDAGIQQWKETLSSSGIDFASAIAVDEANKEVYVGGSVGGSVAGKSISGISDGYVATYDFAGTRTNVEIIGTSGRDSILALDLDPNDSRIDVAGFTNDAFSGQTNAGQFDAFVLEYDRSWNRQWTEQFGSGSIDFVQGLAVDSSSGEIYVGGGTQGAIPSGVSNQGGQDIFTAKYDTTGTRQWIHQSGSGSDDSVSGIAVNESSGALFGAGRAGGAFQGLSHSGSGDAFVMKRDSSGSFQWIDATGSSDDEGWQDLRYDPDSGNLYASGFSNGAPASTTNNGGYDAMAAEYQTGGTRGWVELHGTSNLEYAPAIGSDASSTDLFIGGVWDYDTSTQSGDGFLARIR